MRNTLKNILISLSSVLIALLIGELILQIAYRLQNNRWVWDTDQTFQFDYIIPTDDGRKYTLKPFFYDKVQNMPINQWGERITPQNESPEYLENTIVCMGDSVPFGFGAPHWDTYPYYLSSILQGQGYPYYVINSGVPSYNARQSFEKLKREVYLHVPPEDIDIVILQAANDISLWAYYRENWNEDVTWADVRFNLHKFPLVDRSAIFNYINQVFSPQRGRDKEIDPHILSTKLFSLLSAEVEEIHQQSPEIKVILLPINPFYYQVENTFRNENLSRYERYSTDYYMVFINNLNQVFNEMLESISEQYDYVYFMDIRKSMDDSDREIFFKDYIHLSGEGAQFQAEEIIDFLLENQLISPGGDPAIQ